MTASSFPHAAPDMPAGPWLLVIGMHRSGTSAIAGALGQLGLTVPAARDRYEYYGSAEGNPQHWESRAMGVHDDALLEQLGGTWDCPPDPDRLEGPEADLSFGKLEDPARPARVAFPEPGPIVWKDPRACLLLPYWRAHLPKPLAAVFIWRSPLAVARSLGARNGVDLADGVALWERYNRCGLAALLGTDTFVTKYEAVVEDPVGMLSSIANWLADLPQFAPHAPGWNVDGMVKSISPALNHQADSEDSDPLLGPQLELQRHLEVLAGPHRAFTSTLPGTESPWTTSVLQHRRRAAVLRREVDELKDTLVERKAAAEALAADVAGKLEASVAEAAKLNGTIERLQAEKIEAEAQFADLHEQYVRMLASRSWRMTQPLRQLTAIKDRKGGAEV